MMPSTIYGRGLFFNYSYQKHQFKYNYRHSLKYDSQEYYNKIGEFVVNYITSFDNFDLETPSKTFHIDYDEAKDKFVFMEKEQLIHYEKKYLQEYLNNKIIEDNNKEVIIKE